MDDGARTAATLKPDSAIERAIRNFVEVLSNAQSEVQEKTGATPLRSHPPACLQTTHESTQRKVQRSSPSIFQRRQKRRKQLFPAPHPNIPAVRHIKLSFCLLPASTTKTPKNETRLLQAGLGRRTVGVADNADHEQVFFLDSVDALLALLSPEQTRITRVLHEEYPKMKSLTGGWLLYKAAGGNGQRNLSVVAQGSQGYTCKMLKMATSSGRHGLYIVPLQEEIDTTPLPLDAAEFSKMPKSLCDSCGLSMPLQLFVSHVESCGQVSSQSKAEATKFQDSVEEGSLYPSGTFQVK